MSHKYHMPKGFIFNTNRCVGCHACMVACSNQNGVPPGENWRRVYGYNAKRLPSIPVFFHSLACNHCEDPPCMENCPANAFYRDEPTQAVLVNEKKCMGCKYCSWACPYDVPEYNSFEKIIKKCTLCVEKVRMDDIPACAKCCPTGALHYDEINTTEIPNPVKGFSDHDIGPKIRFVSSGKSERTPEMDVKTPVYELRETGTPEKPPALSALGSEWSLAVFSILVPLLVGLFGGVMVSPLYTPKVIFLLVGIITLVISMLHLGRKDRFYRAIFHLKKSWLSREILFFILFLGISSAIVLFRVRSIWLVGGTLILGFISVFSIDMVYHLKSRADKNFLHSSQVMLTALLFVSIFMQSFFPMVFILVVKLILYLYRKSIFTKTQRDRLLSILRILTGITAPVIIYLIGPLYVWYIILGTVFIGELIDRIEFYVDLEFVTPEKELFHTLSDELERTGSV